MSVRLAYAFTKLMAQRSQGLVAHICYARTLSNKSIQIVCLSGDITNASILIFANNVVLDLNEYPL